MLARLETADGRPVSVFGSVGGAQPDRQEVTVKGSRASFRFTEFYQLWKSGGGEWTAAYDFPADPRRSSLQIGRAHVRTPVTNAHLVCRLLLDKKKVTMQ